MIGTELVETELIAKVLTSNQDCHPSNVTLDGWFHSLVRWYHQVRPRYYENVLNYYQPGYYITIEAEPMKLVNGQKKASWCVQWCLGTWMCSSLQYAMYPTKVKHPSVRGSIPFTDLMGADKKYCQIAEEVIRDYKFPVARRGRSTDGWGE